jgi:hypothetical protein
MIVFPLLPGQRFSSERECSRHRDHQSAKLVRKVGRKIRDSRVCSRIERTMRIVDHATRFGYAAWMAIVFEVELIDGEYRRRGLARTVAGTRNDYLYELRRAGEIERWDAVRTPANQYIRVEGALVHRCRCASGGSERLIAAREDDEDAERRS